MAKLLSDVITIQNEIVRLKQDIKSVQGDGLRSLETRLKAYLVLQAAGGRAPTKRDSIGNILLYEDPVLPGIQLQRADQYLTVEMINPDYDDDQAKEVLDTEINELYIPEDTSEIAKLRRQIEELRQELKNAQAASVEHGGRIEGSNIIFPPSAIVLPDSISGDISSTPLLVDVNTAIFNDTTMTLENFSVANPFTVHWWVIDHVTDEIYSNGIGQTYIRGINKDGNVDNKDLDIVLALTKSPINFNGWYVSDQSTGQLVNFVKFSTDNVIRFRFIKRNNTGSPLVDESVRNTYYIIASFLNESPRFD